MANKSMLLLLLLIRSSYQSPLSTTSSRSTFYCQCTEDSVCYKRTNLTISIAVLNLECEQCFPDDRATYMRLCSMCNIDGNFSVLHRYHTLCTQTVCLSLCEIRQGQQINIEYAIICIEEMPGKF